MSRKHQQVVEAKRSLIQGVRAALEKSRREATSFETPKAEEQCTSTWCGGKADPKPTVFHATTNFPPGYDATWKKLKGRPGYVDPDGNIWAPDMKHKDHWDVANQKGKKIKRGYLTERSYGQMDQKTKTKNQSKRPYDDYLEFTNVANYRKRVRFSR